MMQGIHYCALCCLNIPPVLLMVQVIRTISERKLKKNSFDVFPYGSVLFPMDGHQFQGVISLQKLLANQDGVSKNLLARTRKSHL